MVLPDGSNDSGGRRTSTTRKTLYVTAAFVLAGGALALGTLTDPQSESTSAEATSTTRTTQPQPPSIDVETFTPDQIEVGQSLSWEMSAEIPDLHPISVLEHEGWIYLFGSVTPYWSNGRASGLVAWRSEDGTSWEDLGQVIPDDVRVSIVEATDYGLVAVSGGATGETTFSVWRSINGIEWFETPGPSVESERVSIFPTAVSATDRLVVVTGQESHDPTELLADEIETALGLEVDLSRYGWSQTAVAEGPAITVHGPLGLPVLTVPIADLDLTPEEQDILLGAYGGSQSDTMVWIRWDESEWQQGTIEGSSWIGSLTALPRGGFVALGWSNTGESGWSSFDGLEWSGLPFGKKPVSFVPWGDGLLGAADTSAGLLTSRNGVEWTETPLYLNFPRPISWGVTSYAAGDAGVVAVVEGWRQPGATVETPEPPTLTSGELEMIIDFESGNITVDYGEDSFSFQMWNTPSLPERVSADLTTETISFTDPDTGEVIGTFSFEEIYAAEDDYWSVRYHDDQIPFVAHSPDAEEWSVNSIDTALGQERRIIDLAVGTNRVVGLVVESTDRFRPDAAAGFTVWSAELP